MNQKTFSSRTERLYRNLYLSYNSFAGMRTSFNHNRVTNFYKATKLKKIDDYKKRMRNTIILNMGYDKIMNCLKNNPDVLFYLDPPYFIPEIKHYKEEHMDYKLFFNLVCTVKGKVIVSLNEHKDILNYATTGPCTKKLYIYKEEVKYTTGAYAKKGIKIVNEYIMTNYRVPGKVYINKIE